MPDSMIDGIDNVTDTKKMKWAYKTICCDEHEKHKEQEQARKKFKPNPASDSASSAWGAEGAFINRIASQHDL
eukprot:5061110-Karenia_brevis.AAC.1